MRPTLCLAALAALLPASLAAQNADDVPRLAVMSAFPPEWIALQEGLEGAETITINGNKFVTGVMEGKPVVLFLSGVSMVNAAMTTQLALDRFKVTGIVFSGIAGGVDPALTIGDVVIPAQWGSYLLGTMARAEGDSFTLPPWMQTEFAPLGMIHTLPFGVTSAAAEEPDRRFWFAVDPAMLATAEKVASTLSLTACNAENTCLSEAPKIVAGGNGVSGSFFVDNADLRDWAFATFDARVLDMESAAVAQVAFANDVPFIAFRSLSDLAGGGEGANEMGTFMSLAAGNAATVVRAFIAQMP